VKGLAGFLLGLILALTASHGARAASPFADWSVVVIAGDFRAQSGRPSEVFDNARRDVATQLGKMGFPPGNIHQFSVRPQRYPEQAPQLAALALVRDQLSQTARRATAGCLIYFTSHGLPGKLIMAPEDSGEITPLQLEGLVQAACPGRPAILVLSACYSGSFIDGLAGNDRMILTAARPDRSSFGCGESDKYPYFDACFLTAAPVAHDFIDLSARVRACVAAKEMETGAKPPSEPQVWIGSALRPLLPLYTFPSG
jgi:hypothetical protein